MCVKNYTFYIFYVAVFKYTDSLIGAFIHACVFECFRPLLSSSFDHFACLKRDTAGTETVFRVEIKSLDSVYLINGAALWRSADSG